MDQEERLRSALADRYRIEREIGSGGMASVYLAEDLKHDRAVALKVLKPELAALMGGERFLSEIKTTANLQHPHILPLFDSGEADGFLFYVMPFVEGESLRDRINRERQLPVDQAVSIAGAVASALDYAHRHDVVHRDIKPENILLHDGEPMVADFGIALAVRTAGGDRLTETGLSLGTPHYMSPEQATGSPDVDPRSDVYSLGAVLYEMLAGEPPHTGPTVQAVISKLLMELPAPLSRVRQRVPSNVEAAVQKALSRSPVDRFHTVVAFADALADPGFRLTADEGAHVPLRVRRWKRISTGLAALAAALAVLALWSWQRPRLESADAVVRMAMAFPSGQEVQSPGGTSVSLSADGSRLVYVGPSTSGGQQLWVRLLDRLEADPIPGTEGALNPVFSPDGESVAYLTLGPSALKVVSLTGTPPLTLVVDSVSQYALDWGPDGMLYFNRPDGRLVKMPPGGGAASVVTIPDASRGEVFHRWLDVLPNGKGALFTIWRGFSEHDIGVASLETGETRVLVRGAMARYSSSGHLVFVTADGVLLAAPFDAERMELTGSPTPLIRGVALDGYLGAFQFTLSETGTLVYLPGEGGDRVQAVWVGRDGTESRTNLEIRSLCRCIALSPDGERIAATSRGEADAADDIWVYDLQRESFSRLTFDPASDYRPFWSPDGGRIAFVSNRDGPQSIYAAPADGSGPAELVAASPYRVWEGAWSPDGTWLLYREGTFGSRDMHRLDLDVDGKPEVFLASPFDELMPVFSPDGRWVAYVSNDSGQQEVYVRRADGGGGRWPVSSGGGAEPMWAHSGRELFFRRPTGEMVAVPILAGPTFASGTPNVLFGGHDFPLADSHQGYDVAPDDSRFLMLKRVQGAEAAPVMVLNWFEELGRQGSQRE